MTVTVDAEKMVAAFRAHMQHIRGRTDEGVVHYAERVKDRAKSLIHSESGELAASIKVENHLGEQGRYVEVGADESAHPHAIHVEFGTSKMAARPFLRPAVAESARDFVVEP